VQFRLSGTEKTELPIFSVLKRRAILLRLFWAGKNCPEILALKDGCNSSGNRSTTPALQVIMKYHQ
jgi:hypothetical protein